MSADPYNNPTALTVLLTCDDGFSGEVVVPAFDSGPGGGPARFFQGELGGVGRPRELTVTLPDGTVIEHWSQPGNDYETVFCTTYLGPAFVELKIQRFN